MVDSILHSMVVSLDCFDTFRKYKTHLRGSYAQIIAIGLVSDKWNNAADEKR